MISKYLKDCLYFEALNFENRFNVTKSFYMLNLNISSLQKHFHSLHETLQQLPVLPQIIGISETRIKSQPYLNISTPNYRFLYANSTTQAGGVGSYINNSISFDELG